MASSFERHCHSNYELLYVVEGEGRYMVEGEELPLGRGTLIIMHPYQYHWVSLRDDRPYERYVVNFSRSDLLPVAAALSLLSSPELRGRAYFSRLAYGDAVRSLLDSFAELAETCGEGDESLMAESLHSTLTQSLLLLSREAIDVGLTDDLDKLQLLTYINRNISSELSLDGLSREFFISKYHLCRFFKRQMGVTIFEYISAKRYALAEGYLAQGLPATEVSERVGYRDYSTFYRAYTKRAGHPPARQRNK